jgi:hypothetical protein
MLAQIKFSSQCAASYIVQLNVQELSPEDPERNNNAMR